MPDIYATGDLRKVSNGVFMAVNYIMEDFDAGKYPIPLSGGHSELLTAMENARRMPEIFDESDRVALTFPRAPVMVTRTKDGLAVLLTQDPGEYFSRMFLEAFRDTDVEARVQ